MIIIHYIRLLYFRYIVLYNAEHSNYVTFIVTTRTPFERKPVEDSSLL
jgi:hypothetical protein